jgi:hypothetical protein
MTELHLRGVMPEQCSATGQLPNLPSLGTAPARPARTIPRAAYLSRASILATTPRQGCSSFLARIAYPVNGLTGLYREGKIVDPPGRGKPRVGDGVGDVIKDTVCALENFDGARRNDSVTESKWPAIYGPRPTPRQLKFPLTCVTFPFGLAACFLALRNPRLTAGPNHPAANILRKPCARRPNGSRYPGELGGNVGGPGGLFH